MNLTPPTMEQPQYNMFVREKVEADYAPIYDTYGLGTTIWSPLSSGILTGKYNNGIPNDSRVTLPGYEWLRDNLQSVDGQNKLATVSELAKLAEKVGMPIHHMALLWCLENPNVSTVILGASRKSQLVDNLAALDSKGLMTLEVMTEIETILDNKPDGPSRF